MSLRVFGHILIATAWSVACGDGRGAVSVEGSGLDAAMPDAPAGPVALAYAMTGPSAVSTCEVAAAPTDAGAPADASGPCSPSSSGAAAPSVLYVVFHPADLGAPGTLHPIVTWGNGTGAVPGQYSVLLTHLASWGFVVIASTSPNTGTGQEMLAAEDYLVATSADSQSPFHDRLDVDHIGAMGHSQGADGAAQALLAADAPGSTHRFIATLVPIELPNQEWTCIGSTDPACPAAESFDSKSLVYGSVFYVDGSKDTLIAPPTQPAGTMGEQSVQAYYDATPAQTPRAKGTLLGADHNDIQDRCTAGVGCAGVGPEGYLGYITAWLMYQLRGDARARMAFASTAPEIDRDPAWEYVEHASLP